MSNCEWRNKCASFHQAHIPERDQSLNGRSFHLDILFPGGKLIFQHSRWVCLPWLVALQAAQLMEPFWHKCTPTRLGNSHCRGNLWPSPGQVLGITISSIPWKNTLETPSSGPKRSSSDSHLAFPISFTSPGFQLLVSVYLKTKPPASPTFLRLCFLKELSLWHSPHIYAQNVFFPCKMRGPCGLIQVHANHIGTPVFYLLAFRLKKKVGEK